MVTFFTIGLFICTTLFIFFTTKMEDKNDIKDWMLSFSISYLLLGIIYVIIGGIIFGMATSSMATKWEFAWENKIVAMQDSRAYIMSRHSINSSDRYYYMIDYGNGHYKQHWVSQNKTDIFETNSNDHVIKTYTKIIDPKNWFMKDFEKFRIAISVDERRWEFYVPQGSVVQDFTVDLK